VRRASVIGAACAAAFMPGCGWGGGGSPAAPRERVRLQVSAPADGALVRSGTVDVRGSVSPASADVIVLGRPALVSGGRFTVVVPLAPGVNVVDVAATAGRRRPAFAALRITRDVLVTVPDLDGVVEDDITARLQPLGLKADVQREGGILDVLRPGARAVCAQDPEGGTRVRRGSTLRIVVAKGC
jgi:PASTA domain/Glucodextranase, domain B